MHPVLIRPVAPLTTPDTHLFTQPPWKVGLLQQLACRESLPPCHHKDIHYCAILMIFTAWTPLSSDLPERSVALTRYSRDPPQLPWLPVDMHVWT